MKKPMMVTHFVMALALVFSASAAHAFYFSDGKIEQSKTAQIISGPRDQVALEREEQMNQLVKRSLNNSMRYCYENAILKEPLPYVRATLYITVSPQGRFDQVKADIFVDEDRATQVTELMTCVSENVKKLRLGASSRAATFRVYLEFTSPQVQ